MTRFNQIISDLDQTKFSPVMAVDILESVHNKFFNLSVSRSFVRTSFPGIDCYAQVEETIVTTSSYFEVAYNNYALGWSAL